MKHIESYDENKEDVILSARSNSCGEWSMTMNKLKGIAWADLLLGILLLIMAYFTVTNPTTAFTAFVMAYGMLMILTGIREIIFYFSFSKTVGASSVLTVVLGIANIVLGGIVLFNISIGALTLTTIFPIWIILRSITDIAEASALKDISGSGMYWLTIIMGVISIFLGVLLLFNPFASAITMIYYAAILMALLAVQSIITAFMLFKAK